MMKLKLQYSATRVLLFGAFLLLAIAFFSPKVIEAATTTITTSSDFDRGTFANTEATSKEGELKLKAD